MERGTGDRGAEWGALGALALLLALNGCGGGRDDATTSAAEKSAAVSTAVANTKAVAASRIAVYRFYNSTTTAHFFTTSVTERDQVQATMPQFKYEGLAFYASSVTAAGLSPVYRFFNTRTGVHFYTISEVEKTQIQTGQPQFAYEGIAYYASQTAGTGLLPLYRFYQTLKGFHFYSTSTTERDNIVANLPQYQYEGVGYHVMAADWAPTTGSLPHSGVTDQQCYAAGSDVLVPCSSTGATALNSQQDGHRSATRPMHFSEVAKTAGGVYARSECVKDDVTGLVWEGKTASGPRGGSATFTRYDDPARPQKYDTVSSTFVNPTQAEIDAQSNSVGYVRYVNGLALCGFTDWRLPTPEELQGIVDYSVAAPGPALKTDWFPNALPSTPQAWYATAAGYGSTPYFVMSVDFGQGMVSSMLRSDHLGLRLVRSPSPAPQAACPSVAGRFVAGGAEVTDSRTGLVWARCSVGQTWTGSTCTGSAASSTQAEALQAAQAATGWRLPNAKELLSLSERGCQNPALDATVFPNTPSSPYWASTPYVGYPGAAWYANVQDGTLFTTLRSGSASARLVRSTP